METTVAITLHDEEYKKIARLARGSRIGVILQHKSGRFRFYFKDGEMFADLRDEKGNIHTHPVLNLKEVQEKERTEGTQNDVFKNAILPKLKADHPELNDEEIEAFADILNEANGSVKRLIQQGCEPEIATRLVGEALFGNRKFVKGETPA